MTIEIHPEARVSRLADIEDSVRGTRIAIGAGCMIDSFVKIKPVGGSGDVIRPDEDVVGIGSGGPYAHAAALALLHHTTLPAEVIAREALRIAGQLCIYTNDQVIVETL